MIKVNGLSKHYGSVRAVDDLTFSVSPGVVTGFLGPNGAGKSTTMRMIVGLDRPTAGTALIDGKRYSELKHPIREVGALLDAKAVHPNRSAANHLKWVAQSNGVPTSRVDEVLDLVGLTQVAGKKAGGFSLGMGQRLGLAPAEGRTVLVSSHLLSEMSQTAEQLIVIGRGKLVSHSSTYDFIKHSSTSSVVVRTTHYEEFANALQAEGIAFQRSQDEEKRPTLVIEGRTTDDIGALAYSVGVLLSELTEHKASLEDAFMEMTSDAVQYQGGK